MCRFCLISCINRPGSSARKTHKRFKRCRRMRRTARDVERRCRREAPLSVQPSRYCARARRYEKFRLRDGRIRLIESRLHILADRPCQIDRIGMTGRGDERNAEARHIPRGRSQYIRVKLARGASARRNFAKSERPFERKRLRIRLHRGLVRLFSSANDEVFAAKHPKTVFICKNHLGTRLRAPSAKDAAPHIETRLSLFKSKRAGNGTNGLHRIHIFRRRIGGKFRPPPEIRRKVRFSGRERPCSATFF